MGVDIPVVEVLDIREEGEDNMADIDYSKLSYDDIAKVTIKNSDGSFYNIPYSAAKQSGLVSSPEDFVNAVNRTGYITRGGGFTTDYSKAYFPTAVSLNKDTGNVQIDAPSMLFSTQTYQEKIKPVLETISQNYKLNPEYKYALLNDEDDTKTSEDWIKEVEKELPDWVSSTLSNQKVKDQVKEETGLDLTDEQLIKMSSVALEKQADGSIVQVKDDTVQSLPEVIKNLEAFKNLQGWQNGEVSYKNLMESWNREHTSDEDLLQVYDTVQEYFRKGEFKDADEYAEMVAFSQFIEDKHPETGFWRGVWDGISDAFYNIWAGTAKFDASVLNAIEGTFNFAGTAGASLAAGEWTGKPATGELNFIKDYLVPELEDQVDKFQTNSMRLNEAAGSVGAIFYELTPLAMQMAVGAALGNAAANGVKTAAAKMIATTGEAGLIGVAEGLTAEEVAVNALNGTNFLMRVMSANKANGLIAAAVGTLKAAQTATAVVATTADLAAQIVVDVTVQDSKLARQLIEGDVSNDVKEYVLEQIALDAGGWVVATGAIKTVKGIGKTDVGRVINAAAVPRINKWAARIGEYTDVIKTNVLHHGDANWNKTKADRLRNRLEAQAPEGFKRNRLENAIGAAERRQQNLQIRRNERLARAKVGQLPGVTEGASSWSEIVENANRIKRESDIEFIAAHASADRVYKNDVSARVTKIKNEVPTLKTPVNEYVTQLNKVLRAEDVAGLKRTSKAIDIGNGMALSEINRESNEYVNGMYRLTLGNDALMEFVKEGRSISGVQKEIEYYTNVTQAFREKYPELAGELDRLLELGKKFSAGTQDARVFAGVMAQEQLDAMRTSEYFKNGYLRTQRLKEWQNYQKRGGELNINRIRDDQHLKWGFDGDAPDEFQDITFVLFDDLNQVAKQSIRKEEIKYLKQLGEKVEVEISGDEVRRAKTVNATKIKAEKTIQRTTNNAVKEMDAATFGDIFKYKEAKSSIATAKEAAAKQGIKASKAESKLPRVTRSDKVAFVNGLDTENLNDLVVLDQTSPFSKAVETEEDFQEFLGSLDNKTKKYLLEAFDEQADVLFPRALTKEEQLAQLPVYDEASWLKATGKDKVPAWAKKYVAGNGVETNKNIKSMNDFIERTETEIAERTPRESASDTIPKLDYKTRKDLATKIAGDGSGEYTILYRIQGGEPNKWRPNNRGKKGKFEGNVGEMKGAVWLTSDPDWVEGPERATAGVDSEWYPEKGAAKVTDENIVVIPVKKSDILDNVYSGGEEYKNSSVLRKKLKDKNKKIVQTRATERDEAIDRIREQGIAPRYMDHTNPKNATRTEFILFEQDHPEVLSDGMDLMLEEYNKQFENRINKKAVDSLKRDLEFYKKELRNLESATLSGEQVTDLSQIDELRAAITRIKKSPEETQYTLENLNKILDNDKDFLSNLKRQYVLNNKSIFDDPKLTEVIAKIKQEQAVFDANTLYAENIKKLEKIREEANLPGMAVDLNRQMDEFIDKLIATNGKDESTVKALKALDDSDDVLEYATLKSLTDKKNLESVKNKLYNASRDSYNGLLTFTNKVKKDGKVINKLTGEQINRLSDQWAAQTVDWYEERVNQRFDRVVNKLRASDNDIVDYDDLFGRIKAITDDITGAKKTDDIVKTYDELGYEEYVKLSPTVADLITTMPTPLRRGLFGEIQAEFVKIFRLGTTGGLVPQSLIRQYFRDTGLAVTTGNMTRTMAEVEEQLSKVYGATIAEYYQKEMPDLWETLLTKANETGESVEKLAAKNEMELAKVYAPDQLQSNLYRFNRQNRIARNQDGIYDQSVFNNLREKLENAVSKTEKLNNVRETNRRIWVYNNAYLDALNNGHSVPMARRYAEMIQAEATTNFSRQAYHLANLTHTVPYLGSAINGQKSFWRLMAMDPVGVTTRIVGGYMVPMIALTNLSLSDPENREVYKSIPEYEKDDNLVFVVNGQKISIPIPQEISALLRPIQSWIETMQGANDHSLEELNANNLAGFFPYELQGFVNIDSDRILIEDGFEGFAQSHLLPGFSMLSSQMMGPLVKSGVMWATGYDPYTRKRINTAYTTTDQETGESVIIDYKSGELAKALGNIFQGNFNMSAEMAQAIFNNLLGSGNMNIIDGLSDIAASIPTDEGIGAGLTKAAERLSDAASKPLFIPTYGEKSNQAWKRAVNQLYREKDDIINDAEYQADLKALSQDNLTEDAKNKILSRIKTKKEQFQEKVLKAAQNLMANYDGGTIDRYKFASIISLMAFSNGYSQDPTDPLAKQQSKESYNLAKAKAIETMAQMGFNSPSDNSIFGYYGVNKKTGEIEFQMYSPLAILDFESSSRLQSDIALANIKAAVNDAGLSDAHDSVKEQVNKIYAKDKLTSQDYADIDAIYIVWNAQVAKTLAPYVNKMTPEAAINNSDVRNYLYNFIEVPGDWEVNDKGRRASLGSRGNKKKAYYDSWIKSMFGINDKYKGQY